MVISFTADTEVILIALGSWNRVSSTVKLHRHVIIMH